MPALRVADVTIHLHAAGVDRDEPHDPRVRWEYLIEGRSLLHAGRDLTTPYHGASSIADQLPAAMATLLTHLDHLADTSHDAGRPVPMVMVAWARHHRDHIAAIIDLLDHGTQPRTPASTEWQAITRDPDLNLFGRWCVGQATQHADRVATLNPRPDTAAGLVARDELWHEQALAFYTRISNTPQPEPSGAPVCVVASRERIRAWLDEPATNTAMPVADVLDLGDAGLDRQLIPALIDLAQHAGIFGVAGHTIRAHLILDDTRDPVATLLTVTTPDGARLATTPIAVHDLDRFGGGAFPVADLLTRFAAHVQDALTTTPPSAADARARPFPRLDAIHPSTPNRISPLHPPTDAPRHAR